MPHMHWVARQNKLELPNDEEEVNTRDIHKCDGQAHDPDTMAAPLTPKPTRKAEALARAPPTIVSRRKEDVALKEVAKPRLCCANGIFETKTKDGSTAAKAPAPRTNPNTKEAPTAPKPHTHPSHECDGQARNPGAMTAPLTPKPRSSAWRTDRAVPAPGAPVYRWQRFHQTVLYTFPRYSVVIRALVPAEKPLITRHLIRRTHRWKTS